MQTHEMQSVDVTHRRNQLKAKEGPQREAVVLQSGPRPLMRG